MAEGYRRDHRIGESNRLTCALQVAPDAARKLGRRLIEFEDFLGVDMGKQGENLLRTLDFLESLDHLHDSDDGEGESSMRLAVRLGMADHCDIHRAKDFGENVGVEDGLTHPVKALACVSGGLP